MTKISKVFLYIFTLFVALMVIAFLALTITSSYGGIKLNFLEERIENSTNVKKTFKIVSARGILGALRLLLAPLGSILAPLQNL